MICTVPLPFVTISSWGYELGNYVWVCRSDYTRMIKKDEFAKCFAVGR